jgi:hypothetical protein
MILDKKVLIKCKGNNRLNIYKDIGYDTTKDFFINIEHLLPTSTCIISAECDYCKKKVHISYKNYYRNVNRSSHKKYACSRICANEKIRKTTIKKYGVDHISKSNEIINKKKETNLEKYGVSTPLLLKSIKSKILEKYGVENVFSSENIKEKIKKTNLEKYGVENVFSSENIKEKIKKTNLEKYGVEYFINSDYFLSNINNIKIKIKETNIENHGGHPSKNENYRKLNTKIANCENYIKYLDNSISLFKCDKGHNFEISIDNYIGRIKNNISLCTICNPIGEQKSIKEKNLICYIESIYSGKIIQSYRDGLEIDIYLPELNLGFEFNGLYWHSEQFKEKNYHLNKTNYFKEKGIRIIHIWEDDWSFKQDIIKSQIRNLLGINSEKIFARSCKVKEISNTKIVKEFLDRNHIQGNIYSTLKIGLFYNNELVSLMLFDHFEGRKRMEEGGWNLSRFCNVLNTNIIGGASKLLTYFIKVYKPKRIISYADKDWSIGYLYYKLGFENILESKPDYKYIINNKRVHKSRYKKSKLKTKLTESQQMQINGIDKIYDCGKIKFEKIIINNVI